MFFSIQFQIKEVLKNWFFQLLAWSWFWWMLFSIQILLAMTIEILFFLAFGKILVLANVFFSIQNLMKKYWKLIFQLLARSWVWRMLFFYRNSNWKSIENLIFSSFGKILVLANVFFYSKSNEKVLKIDLFSFWQDLGFGECFFLLNF